MSEEPQERIFYHVPVEIIDELKKYRTKNSKFVLRYRYRDPVKGIPYDPYGGVLEKHAQTASIYLRNAEPREAFKKMLGRHWKETEELKGKLEVQDLTILSNGEMLIERDARILVLEREIEILAKRGDIYYRRWKRLRHWLPVRILLKLHWALTGKEYGHEESYDTRNHCR